jgi:tetratricopeptide (TPR) repeat protein
MLALEEVDQAIQRFPTMAVAYARKGSIYYQMGDLQQATINWNLALKYDPGYIEVQEMLSSIKKEIDKISSYNN